MGLDRSQPLRLPCCWRDNPHGRHHKREGRRQEKKNRPLGCISSRYETDISNRWEDACSARNGYSRTHTRATEPLPKRHQSHRSKRFTWVIRWDSTGSTRDGRGKNASVRRSGRTCPSSFWPQPRISPEAVTTMVWNSEVDTWAHKGSKSGNRCRGSTSLG